MKLAVLGGSFDPIHLGHLRLADLVLEAFDFDRILLVPANISPFKKAPGVAAEDRLDMILASITADPRISADDAELRRGGVSYTIDTLEEIIDRYRPDGKPGLVLGDDLAADFSQWKNAEKIAEIADIIVARRMAGNVKPDFPFPHQILNNETMDLASATIRERIASGGAWHYLVSQGARNIIEDRGLYSRQAGSNDELTNELISRVENAARAVLSARRFIHSRNTALMARDMAIRFGLDGNAAYLAGIAHDMAKKQAPGLFHGRAAAVLLQERFSIHNKDVLEAVEFHTTGRPGMGNLAKVVFIADKIEFSRQGTYSEPWKSRTAGSQSCTNTAISRFREMAVKKPQKEAVGLTELFFAVLENNVAWLENNGIKAAEESFKLLEEKP